MNRFPIIFMLFWVSAIVVVLVTRARSIDVKSGDHRLLKGHNHFVSALASNIPNDQLISGSDDGTTIIWDYSKRQMQRSLTSSSYGVQAIAVSPCGSFIVISSDEDLSVKRTKSGLVVSNIIPPSHVKARVWDLRLNKQIALLKDEATIHSVVFSPTGSLMATATRSSVSIWKAGNWNKPIWETKASLTPANGVIAFSPNGDLLATGGIDGDIMLFDTKKFNLKQSWRAHDGAITALVFIHRSELLLSGGWDGNIKTWDSRAMKLRKTWSLAGKITCIAFSPERNLLAAGSRLVSFEPPSASGTLSVWKMQSGNPQLIDSVAVTGGVSCVAFCPNRRCLAFGRYGSPNVRIRRIPKKDA